MPAVKPLPKDDPMRPFARLARLRYVRDTGPGFTRVTIRKRVQYRDGRGRVVSDTAVVERITKLAIPPAWEKVWICPADNGHIQAVGYDARGRKQYRYHPRWREVRDAAKYDGLTAFGAALPGLRRRVAADLGLDGLPRAMVLAAVVHLLDRTHLRVGNVEYVRTNQSHGLSTLFDEHVAVRGAALRLKFRGKSGVWHDRTVTDARLAKVVKRCRDLPGDDLFQYLDPAGVQRGVTSADVNGYVRDAAGGPFTAKLFRTWAGTVRAMALLAQEPPPASEAARNRAVVRVVKEVAAELGNTPAVCRASYVHPAVIAEYLRGGLVKAADAPPVAGLTADEARLVGLLGGRPRRKSKAR